MKHASLQNPFNLVQQPGGIARQASEIARRSATRSTPVCSNCQSDDIISHAIVQWSNELQEWVLASTFGQPAHCHHCNGACNIKWLPLS